MTLPIPQGAREAARAGRKIEAIKIVRAEMAVELQRAKELVDAYLASTAHERDQGSGRARTEGLDTRMPQEALEALEGGRHVEAIKIVRAHFGVGLRDAKAAVNRHLSEQPRSAPALEAKRLQPAVKSGCSAYAALAVLGWLALELLKG